MARIRGEEEYEHRNFVLFLPLGSADDGPWAENDSLKVLSYWKKSKGGQYFEVCGNLWNWDLSVHKWGFMETCSFVYLLPMADFLLHWQRWVVVIEITWPTKSQIFTLWSCTKKVCQPDPWSTLTRAEYHLSLCYDAFSSLGACPQSLFSILHSYHACFWNI